MLWCINSHLPPQYSAGFRFSHGLFIFAFWYIVRNSAPIGATAWRSEMVMDASKMPLSILSLRVAISLSRAINERLFHYNDSEKRFEEFGVYVKRFKRGVNETVFSAAEKVFWCETLNKTNFYDAHQILKQYVSDMEKISLTHIAVREIEQERLSELVDMLLLLSKKSLTDACGFFSPHGER